ncbi:hypothetical protein ACTAZI_16005 [Legionella bozemanae]
MGLLTQDYFLKINQSLIDHIDQYCINMINIVKRLSILWLPAINSSQYPNILHI